MKAQEYLTCVSREETGILQENWKTKNSRSAFKSKNIRLVIESKVITKACEFGLDLVVQTL